MNRGLLVISTLLVLIALFATGAYLFQQQQESDAHQVAQQHAEQLIRDHSPRKGKADAKVTIVEFFDPACETCRAFHPFVEQLQRENPGMIRVVMRYIPLHHGSDYAVAMLDAAHLQNKFWPALEAIYAHQERWAAHHNPQPGKIWALIEGVGLDLKRLEQEMQNPEIIDHINQDIRDAAALGVEKTPGFFVNGKPLIEFGYQQLRELVESEL